MAKKLYRLVANVNTDNPKAIRPVLERLVGKASIKRAGSTNEFLLEAELNGESAKDLNRLLLSELRKAEKKTRLRAQWTSGGTTERFFDYVPKGTQKAAET
jgi:hypothetical protein